MAHAPARTLIATLASLVAVTALSSCSSGDPSPSDPAAGSDRVAPDGPLTLQPASDRPAAGTTRVTCDVTADSGPVRLVLDLPEDLTPRRPGDRDCVWGTRVRVHDSDISYAVDVVVAVESVGADASLADVHAEQEPFEVDGDTPEGDDSILDLVLEEDVPAIGAAIGDRLSWRCFCDGQDLITRMAQADGVRVTWSSVVPLTQQTDAAFARALAGAGTTE